MLYDAHCHPTERPQSLDKLPAMNATMCIMTTRVDDIDIVQRCAKYPNVIPAYGLHPWWSYLLSTGGSKRDHYRRVFVPVPEDSEIDGFPDVVSIDEHLQLIRRYLEADQTALVGEIGLDKAFRVRLDDKLSRFRVNMVHQELVFERQLEIAQELLRPVSIHGVQAPGRLFDSVQKFTLPAICLHSYSGSTEFYTQRWQKLDTAVYVSGAVIINMPDEARARELFAGVPSHLVLSESDYGEAGDDMMHLLRKSQDIIANIYGWDDAEAEETLSANFWAFVRPPRQSPRHPHHPQLR